METMEITVNNEGGVQVAVKGVKGKACKDVSAAIEKALGKVTASVPTGEMYEETKSTVKARG